MRHHKLLHVLLSLLLLTLPPSVLAKKVKWAVRYSDGRTETLEYDDKICSMVALCGVPRHKSHLGLVEAGLAALRRREAVQTQMRQLMVLIPQKLLQDLQARPGAGGRMPDARRLRLHRPAGHFRARRLQRSPAPLARPARHEETPRVTGRSRAALLFCAGEPFLRFPRTPSEGVVAFRATF